MLVLNSPDLVKIHNSYLAIIGILEYAKKESIRRIKQNSDFLYTINFPYIGELKPKDKEGSLREVFMEIFDNFNESFTLSIVGEFERCVFDKISNSSILIRTIVSTNYISPQPMHTFGEHFVKNDDDIFNLKGFNSFLISHPGLKIELQEIIDYRNYLAHGKRSIGKPSNKTVEQIIIVLDTILSLL